MADARLIAAREHLRAQGWAVLPDVIDQNRAAEVTERLWRAAEESRRRGVDTFMPVLDPNASNVRVFYLLELDAVFRDLVEHPSAVGMVESLLGANFLISNFTANIARPGSKSMALHSDLSLVMPEPWLAPLSLNIIWCLTDVTRDNGATLFIPGSHLWKTREDAPQDAHLRLQPFEARAGSIIAMDGRLWHTSGANVTQDQDRALLFGYYTRAFLRPQVNWNACLDPAIQASLSPLTRRRLGLERDANTGEGADLRPLEVQIAAMERAP